MIEFTDVEKSYAEGNVALRGITMQIEDGEFAFLVGPSGSGKSTIIKLITGELKPTAGAVHVNGYSLERIRKREIPFLRRTVGVVFQDFRLIGTKTVYENVAFAMRVIGAREKEIRDRVPYVLDLVGLETKAKRHPGELSGGERQRLAIARALVRRPDILIFDDSFSALDVSTDARLRQAMGPAAAGITKVIVAQRVSTITEADQILVLADGKIVQQGKHETLAAQPGLYADFVGGKQDAASWKL